MKKRILAGFAAAVLVLGCLTGCSRGKAAESTAAAETAAQTAAVQTTAAQTTAAQTSAAAEAVTEAAPGKQEITILFTNDIHTYVNNTSKDKDGKEQPALRYSVIKAYADKLKKEGKNVLLVDAGDELQGSVYGNIDKGSSIIDLMNLTGYDLATPGNHDYDYGMENFLDMIKRAEYPYISCNFRSDKTGELVLPATKVFEIGGKKIAFVGISTPETVTSSTPKFFQDENGKFIYSFDGDADPEKLFASVQAAVDSVRDEADMVIALGHVGNGLEEKRNGVSSEDVIRKTEGIDVFLDGHSHNSETGRVLSNRVGKEVTLTQNGAYLASFGELVISPDGSYKINLLTGADVTRDEQAEALEDLLKTKVDEELGQKVGTLENTLYINNPAKDGQRLVRAREVNSGDFMTDSIYWYFNEKMDQPCDIVLCNGGGIRAQVEAGDIRALDVRNMAPFGNQVCLIRASGQQILDALEMGVTVTGIWDTQWDSPMENGGFLHVAGLRYTVDTSVETSVKTDEKGNFLSADGVRRIRDAEVYDRSTGTYVPLDPEGTYTTGGINYILRNGGNGLVMFNDCQGIMDFAGQDSDVLIEYIKAFRKEGEYPLINTENSPLSVLENYQLDYKNPFGAGRISIPETRVN